MSLNFRGERSKNVFMMSLNMILLYLKRYYCIIRNYYHLFTDLWNYILIKKIIVNGDISQNLPVLFDLNNISHEDKYLIECINSMFNNQIILTINKRLENEEDRDILTNLKDDIFNLNLNVMDIYKKI